VETLWESGEAGDSPSHEEGEEYDEGEDEGDADTDVYNAVVALKLPPSPPPAGLTGFQLLDSLSPTVLAGGAGSLGALALLVAYAVLIRPRHAGVTHADEDEDEEDDEDDDLEEPLPKSRSERSRASSRTHRDERGESSHRTRTRYDRIEVSHDPAPDDDDEGDDEGDDDGDDGERGVPPPTPAHRDRRGKRSDLSRYDTAPAAMDPRRTREVLDAQEDAASAGRGPSVRGVYGLAVD